jgi:DNA-binding response OmpR family regulator
MKITPVRVLLIEDDRPLSNTLAKHLRARGHEVRIAFAGQDALAALKSGFRPDVVLLDVNLPDQSGWDLLRHKTLALAGDPPVFIMTAIAVSPARLREFHCAGYLPKPFAMSTLVEIVERHGVPSALDEAAALGLDE